MGIDFMINRIVNQLRINLFLEEVPIQNLQNRVEVADTIQAHLDNRHKKINTDSSPYLCRDRVG
jgi:hypothetical protein